MDGEREPAVAILVLVYKKNNIRRKLYEEHPPRERRKIKENGKEGEGNSAKRRIKPQERAEASRKPLKPNCFVGYNKRTKEEIITMELAGKRK